MARIRNRLGVRGYALLLCAFVWSLVGLGLRSSPAPGVNGTFHDELPMWIRIGIWFGSALAAAVLAWIPRLDWIALGLLVVGPILRCLSYLTAWVLYLSGHHGLENGWYAASIYIALIGIVAIASVSHRQPYLSAPESR